MSVTFKAVGRSDVGQVRTNNEDSAAITTIERHAGNYDAWLVADGMGGLAQGEVASGLALETVIAYLRTAESWDDPAALLLEAILDANTAVYQRGTAGGEITQSGMGTTLVAVVAEEATGRYWVANVGDSRVYLLSPAGITQLTHDHSLVADRIRVGEITEEEARTARHRNVITRAVGVEPRVEPEVIGPLQFHAGERVLLCSDGLHGMLTEDEIVALAEGASTESLPDRLIDAANQAGGRDNVTVVVGAVEGAPPLAAAAPPAVVVRPVIKDSAPLFAPESGRRPARGLVAIGSIAAIAVVAVGIWLGVVLLGGGSTKPTSTPAPAGNHQSQSNTGPEPSRAPITPATAPAATPTPTAVPTTPPDSPTPPDAQPSRIPGRGEVPHSRVPRRA